MKARRPEPLAAPAPGAAAAPTTPRAPAASASASALALPSAKPARPRGLSQGLLAEVVGYRIVQASLATGTTYDRHIGEPLKLRKVEYSLLVLLHANAQATPKQLAAALSLSAPNLTILLDRMQQRGLIVRERSDTDRRSQHVRLTPEGQVLTHQAIALTPGMEHALDACLSRAERALLIELLDKIARSRSDQP